jgi:hypothetical protein
MQFWGLSVVVTQPWQSHAERAIEPRVVFQKIVSDVGGVMSSFWLAKIALANITGQHFDN